MINYAEEYQASGEGNSEVSSVVSSSGQKTLDYLFDQKANNIFKVINIV